MEFSLPLLVQKFKVRFGGLYRHHVNIKYIQMPLLIPMQFILTCSYCMLCYVIEGMFEQYISDQDYKPKWTAIEPISSGNPLSIVQCMALGIMELGMMSFC